MSKTVWSVEDIRKLGYNDIRKLAREHGLKANSKKLELVISLTEKLVHSSKVKSDDDLMEVDPPTNRPNDTLFIAENSLANSTYIVEEPNQSKNGDIFLSADETVLAGNLVETLASSDEKENSDKKITRPSRSKTTRLGINSETPSQRFKKSHELEFQKMEYIGDFKKRLEDKHKKIVSSRSATIERLATPKQAKEPIRRRFRTPSQPKVENFKFGDVPAEAIESVQKPPAKQKPSRIPARRVATRQPKEDVKSITKKAAKTAIVPMSRIEQLAIPKSKGAPPISAERRSYTPNKSPYRYVDTTKMSNVQFRAYQRQKKQEEARANKMVL